MEVDADLLGALVSSAPDAILMVDARGIIRFANPAAGELFAYDEGELIGAAVESLVPEARRGGHAKARTDWGASPAPRQMGARGGPLVGVRKDGREVPLDIMIRPVDATGAAVAIARDVSARRTLEREREEALSQLQARNRELVASLAAQNRLLGFAAHDLRNPLTAVLGYGELLQEGLAGELKPAQRRAIDQMVRSASYMLDMTHELLEVARLDDGELMLQLEPCDLLELLQRSIDRFDLASRKKDIRVRIESALDSAPVKVDANRLAQVLDNLVSNAIKYSHAGGAVVVSIQRSSDAFILSVRDEGVGIPEAEHGAVFAPFKRTSARPTAGETATGLGLAIARRIVDEHGGRIWFESASGSGSTFHVALAPSPA